MIVPISNILYTNSDLFVCSDACVANNWAEGGAGAVALARAVCSICESSENNFKFLYPLRLPIKEKIEAIATQIYGAKDVSYSPEAEEKIDRYTRQVFTKMHHIPLQTDAKNG